MIGRKWCALGLFVPLVISSVALAQQIIERFSLRSELGLTLDTKTKLATITSLSPPTKHAGDTAFTLTVTGFGFTGSAVVKWNGQARPTTRLSLTQLQATINKSDISTAGKDLVTVHVSGRWGGESAPATFTVSPATSTTTTSPPPAPAPSPLTITTTSLPGGKVSVAYTATLAASGGTTPYTWSSGGGLPPGLTLSGSGTISGTPTTAGTYQVTVNVADSAQQATSHSYSLTTGSTGGTTPPPPTPSAITITATTVPTGTVGVSYSTTLAATGGTAPYTWSTVTGSGTLPPGLALSANGAISGTPTTAGTYPFTAQVADSAQQTASQSYTLTVANPPTGTSGSRGYVTTLGELKVIAQKAAAGTEPYKSAVAAIKSYAGSASNWSYGSISGNQTCSGTMEPAYIGYGSPLVEAKALVFGLTGDTTYAAEVRTHLLGLTSTYGYNGDTYSGGNQCILNLSWYMHGWIVAADLLEGYSSWTATDKQQFQTWLATEIYKKVDWASDRRSNNWGAAGSATAGMIADYLSGSGILMVDRNGASINSHDAYLKHKQRQLDRMNSNTYMDNSNCSVPTGFQPDGGIPEELARGSTGCDGLWFASLDSSWTYTMTHLAGTISHAEFLLRRGDSSLYDNLSSTGRGSLLRAIYFLLHNPNDATKSVDWKESHKMYLEFCYRHYKPSGSRDPYIANQLRVGSSTRYIGGADAQMLHFGTIMAGFATSEDPAPPPTTTPP